MAHTIGKLHFRPARPRKKNKKKELKKTMGTLSKYI
jgi:hypothetical protein